MTKIKVSIVVPAYGVEEFLPECLDSILDQSYRNIEIIIVDDKSPDLSGKIADEYASRDERVIVVHKLKNEGLNMARATGVAHSRGSFVTFVDSDDKVSTNYIERLIQAQSETKADITMCGYTFYDINLEAPLDPQPIQQFPIKAEPSVYTKDQMIRYYLTQWTYWNHNNNTTTTCCKLFTKNIINSFDWRETDYNVGEDDFETIYTFSIAKKYAVINDQMYFYRANPNSISNSKKFTPKYQGNSISAFEIGRDFEYKANKLFGKKYETEIYYRVYTIYQHYISLLLNKNSLSLDDITKFDNFFPLRKIKSIRGYPVDQHTLNLIEEGGLLHYLTSWLWSNNHEKQSRINNLESRLAANAVELKLLEDEALSYLHVKRSARLLAGNIKRQAKDALNKNS